MRYFEFVIEVWRRALRSISEVGDLLPRSPSSRLKSNVDNALDLNGRESDETVFIIGASAQLNSLTPPQLRALGGRPTIGVNRTQFAVHLTYFLSAYPHEVHLARSHSPRVTAINMRPTLEPPLIRGTISLKRVEHSIGDTLPPSLQRPEPALHTRRNVALGATHLALILGARRVVYVGVQQTNKLHFWDEKRELRDMIARKLKSVPSSLFSVDHHYSSREEILARLRTPVAELAEKQFYEWSHRETFEDYFHALRTHGVLTFATTEDSVVAAAGAPVVTLDEALSW